MGTLTDAQMVTAREVLDLAKTEATRRGWGSEAQEIIDRVLPQLQPHPADTAASTYTAAFDEDTIDDWTHDEIRGALRAAFRAGHDNASKESSVRTLSNAYAR